jgi:hypothetical protein
MIVLLIVSVNLTRPTPEQPTSQPASKDAGARRGRRLAPFQKKPDTPEDPAIAALRASVFDFDAYESDTREYGITALADDPSVRWEQANYWGIQMDAEGNTWHAGRVMDVLALETGDLIVGTETGGVWLAYTSGQAISLADWDGPDVSALAFGPDGPRHIYAAAGDQVTAALYETDTSSRLPLFSWRQIPAPPSAGIIYRLAVLRASRRIVAVCNSGVWWSPIPAAPTASGSYNWQLAAGLPGAVYSGLAVGPNDSVAVGLWGWQPCPATGAATAILAGDWTTGNLTMSCSTITGATVTNMSWVSLASSDVNQAVMYALTTDSKGKLIAILRSGDGGKTWNATSQTLDGNQDAKFTLQSLFGDNTAGGWLKHISVSPFNPSIVAFGSLNPFISTNGGRNWRVVGGQWTKPDTLVLSPHQHADTHMIHFNPRDPQRLYIASDGGVAMSPDLGATFNTAYNQHLATLQFYSSSAYRNFLGTLAASYQLSGVVAGGLQDNGNVYSSGGGPWVRYGCGDGGWMIFLRIGLLVANCVTGYSPSFATWNGVQFGNPVQISVVNGPAKLTGGLEIVNNPEFRRGGQLMYALSWDNATVFGLFAEANGNGIRWERLGSVPVGANQAITAVGSSTGNTVFVGTSEGRMFALTSQTGSVRDLNVPVKSNLGSIVGRIVVQSDSLAFAIFNTGAVGFIMRWDGIRVSAVGGGTLFALETNWTTSPRAVFAATDGNIYVSRDNGNTWQLARQGLPRRPHCSDLRFVIQGDGARYLYLSTYGRSVWRARL